MQHLLILNYAMDSKDPIFPHQISIVSDLIPFAENISVITYKSSPETRNFSNKVKIYTLRNNDTNKFFAYLKFVIIFFSIIQKHRNTVVFSHMTETLSAVVSPFTRFLKVKHYLWYAHKSKPLRLRWCNIFVDKIITSTKNSCPINNNKVIPIGQAIKYQDFSCSPDIKHDSSKIHAIHVGRIDPSKKIDKIIEIFFSETANSDAILHLVGEPTDGNTAYLNQCKTKFKKQIESGTLVFHGRYNHYEIMNLLCKCQIFIHLFQGSLDKSLVEAIFTKIYVITSNNEFHNDFPSLLNRSIGWSDEDYLRFQLKQYFEITSAQIETLNNERYNLAMRNHSRSVWIDKLVSILNLQLQ